VDVPGHARFVKNMLAGVGWSTPACSSWTPAEGWKPQSEEHLRILDLVGVAHGVIALTKVGLVDDHQREAARAEVTERVAGTFLAGAPIVVVDAPSGIGVADLRAALQALPPARSAVATDRPRLWIDRAFVARGSGTVVTGTLTGGSLRPVTG
jgi:selenocysteine-specific elongation factor